MKTQVIACWIVTSMLLLVISGVSFSQEPAAVPPVEAPMVGPVAICRPGGSGDSRN